MCLLLMKLIEEILGYKKKTNYWSQVDRKAIDATKV